MRGNMDRHGKGRKTKWQLAATALVMLAAVLSLFVVARGYIAKTKAAATAAANWKTYAFNPERTGYNAKETIINPSSAGSIKLLWSVSTGSIISVQPVIFNNLIYWGSWDGNLHATRTDGTQ